ncbi:MAG: ABC transporter permease [Actinomycetota bacterium]|nr:ABC transporter permease [Actinomycetota bacterium]
MISGRRLEPAAIAGVMSRELTLFRRYWPTNTFASVVEPTIYLLAFGFGFGSLVATVGGYDYIEFVGTGVVATAVLFSSAFPGMFGTFIKRKFQRTYDAILAAPVDVEELLTAEALWIAIRAGVYGMAPLLVAVGFGLRPGPAVVLVPLIGLLTGFGFAMFGIWMAGVVSAIDQFNYIISAVLTPLFLVAGTFFPVESLPGWAAVAAQFNPLFHCVELVRHAVFGLQPAADLVHAAALALFAFLMWRLGIWQVTKRLID